MPAAQKPGRKSASKRATKGNSMSSTTRAGVVMPVSRFNRMFKHSRVSDRSGVSAGVFMAAVVEYLVAEIFELAGV